MYLTNLSAYICLNNIFTFLLVQFIERIAWKANLLVSLADGSHMLHKENGDFELRTIGCNSVITLNKLVDHFS